jgi:hypothetical protein
MNRCKYNDEVQHLNNSETRSAAFEAHRRRTDSGHTGVESGVAKKRQAPIAMREVVAS